jgi:beta-lactam-binding protein with PASTA domain
METALPYLKDPPEDFQSPEFPYASPKNVVQRNGRVQLDNGYCRDTVAVEYFGGGAPTNVANCKPNEVDVPSVVGQRLAAAKQHLAAQPLTTQVVYRPAAPKQRLGIVLRQFPAHGTLSSYDKVTLVLPKPLHGIVPRLLGLTVKQAKERLKRLKIKVDVSPGGAGGSARVIAQSPRAGVAAAPHLTVKLSVRRG